MKRLTLFLFSSMLFFACNDPCKDVNCGNGTCDEETGNCICDDWYSGTNCETEIRTKFLGTWNSTSPCNLGSQNSDPVWTIETAVEVNTFILRSPDVFTSTIIEVTLNTDNMGTITPFTVGSSDLSGSITYINETTMTMEIPFVSPSDSFTCTYSMTK